MATQLGNLENQSTQVVKPMPKSINKQLLKEIPSLEKALLTWEWGASRKIQGSEFRHSFCQRFAPHSVAAKRRRKKEILKNETEVQFTPPFGHGWESHNDRGQVPVAPWANDHSGPRLDQRCQNATWDPRTIRLPYESKLSSSCFSWNVSSQIRCFSCRYCWNFIGISLN